MPKSTHLPSYHIDEIDKAVREIRGVLGLCVSALPPKGELQVFPEDLAAMAELLGDLVSVIDRHAQALWKRVQPSSS